MSQSAVDMLNMPTAAEHLREAGWRLAAVTAEEMLFRHAAV
ncbi:hypothetical protein [Micromonospora sp. B9E7]